MKSTLSDAISKSTSSNKAQTPSANASGVSDSRYSKLGNGGYDVQHYTLDLNVTDVKNSNLNATTTIEAKATQNLNRFNLDFVGFAINDFINSSLQTSAFFVMLAPRIM